MTGIIILAAGESSRLGQPKQSLQFNGKTLLQHTVHAAKQTGCGPVVLVLGSNASAIMTDIENEGLHVVINDDWQQGMASSIKKGLTELVGYNSDVDDIILMVCDQPYINAALLGNLIKAKELSGKDIVACTYNGTLGVPALFDKKYFKCLTKLEGNEGAKKLLFQYQKSVATLVFPQGNIDIDTLDDYKKLIEK